MALFSFGASEPAVTRAISYFRCFGLWVGLWAAFTGAVLWFLGKCAWGNHLFADHARRAMGTVFQRYTTVSQGRQGSPTNYQLFYAYRAGDVLVNASVTVEGATYAQVSEGGVLPVKYLPEDPANSRVDNPAEDSDQERRRGWDSASGW